MDWEEDPPPSAPISDSEHQLILVLIKAAEQPQLVATSSLLPQTLLGQELVDSERPSGSNAPKEVTSRNSEGPRSGRLSMTVVQGCPLLAFGVVFASYREIFTGMLTPVRLLVPRAFPFSPVDRIEETCRTKRRSPNSPLISIPLYCRLR